MPRSRLAGILFGPDARSPGAPARRSGPRDRRAEPTAPQVPPGEVTALEPFEVTALEPFEADPGAGLGPAVAQLRVVRITVDGTEVFGVSGSCCCAELPFYAPREHGRPQLDLGTLMSRRADEGGVAPAKILHWMRGWSESKRALIGWLNRVRATHRDDLRLIIWDDTGFDIHWELLWLPESPSTGVPAGWLGAEVAVSRRTTLHSEHARPLTAASCRGEIVGFVDERDGEIAADLPLLHDLGIRSFPSFGDLLDYLEPGGSPLALVYVACHGVYSLDGFDYTIGEIPLSELSGRILKRLAEANGIVFLNCCHSGRLIFEERFNDQTLRGFAKVFLNSGAAGLIGTAGEVGTRSAREVARTLIRRLRGAPGTPVAVALRDHRRTLVPDRLPPVRDAAANRALLPFFYAFMYVYYGSPHSTVALDALDAREAREAGNGGGR